MYSLIYLVGWYFIVRRFFFGGEGVFPQEGPYTMCITHSEASASPPGNQIWRTMFGKKGFDSRLNVAARNQSPFLYFICQYKRMSNRSVLGSLLSLSAPEDPPTFSSSNALAMMTSSGDGMTHQGHWPYHLLENCKNQLLKTKERSCLVRSIRKRQHHLRQIFSTTLSGDKEEVDTSWSWSFCVPLLLIFADKTQIG